jgi:hypothetical protein
MMRLDQARIIISGDNAYESEVRRLVDRILTTKTGQAIDFKIRAHGWAWIFEGDSDDANATTRRAMVGPMAKIVFSDNTKLDNNSVDLDIGDGQTLKVRTLRMHPGWGPDEVLFHELVHAARIVGFDDGPLDEEEFFSVLITNIYISEKGKSYNDLRYRYSAFSRGFYLYETFPMVYLLQKAKSEDHYELIDKFCKQHPNVAPMIAKAPAAFNPIRDYFTLKENLNDIKLNDDVPGPVPVRITQNEPYVPITDYYLISLLEPRFRADDVAGYGERARKLEQVFGRLTVLEAAPLLARLVYKAHADKVAMYFHGHLSTATRKKLINILRGRLTGN